MINDVELLLSTHGVKYQKKGHVIKSICPNPEHMDSHIGSFSFDLIKGVGYCFACGCSVNIFSMNKLLGEKGGFDKNYNPSFLKSLKPKQKEEIKYSKPIVYGKLYNPFTSNEIMDFIHSIGWSDEFVEEKGVKYCRYCEMIAEDLSNDSDEKSTIMENRIVIPIYKEGKLVNYECRTFDNNPIKVKYVRGCSSNMIYNMDNINLNEEVVLSEGIKNIGKCYSVNKNVISSFGNQITDVKLEMLNKIPKLLVFLDNDDGGLVMAKKLKEGYIGELKATFCPKFYNTDKGKKGFDMNNCSLDEISFYLQHTMSIDKAINKLSFNEEESNFW